MPVTKIPPYTKSIIQHCQSLFSALLLLLLLITPAMALPVSADTPMPGDGDTTCWDGSSDGSGKSMAGKPVNLYSGSETMRRTDLTLGSLYPITIQRMYSSTSAYDSPLGYGWAMNYDKRLYTYPDGSITVRKDCGQKLKFIWSVLGYFTTSGDSGKLVQNANGTYTYTEKDGSKENYDVYGRIASFVDPKGNSLAFTYIADYRTALIGLSLFNIDQMTPLIVSYDYRLSKVEEKDASGSPTGAWIAFAYDTFTGRLNSINDSTGRTVTYTHDSIGNLTGVVGPSGTAAYSYNAPGNRHSLTSIDEGQGTYTNAYDTHGRVIRQTHGTGVIDIAYLIPNQKIQVTTTINDPEGTFLNTQVRTVEFNAGVVVKNTDTFGNETHYIRDTQTTKIIREETWENTGTVSAPTLTLKTATNYTYDSLGNMLTRTEAQGTSIEKTTTYTYHPTFNGVLTETVQSVVDPNQYRVRTNTYDETGNLLSTTETGLLGDSTNYTHTTTYGYDSMGRLTSIDGPRTDVNDITTYFYEPVTGYRTGVTQPLVGTTVYSNFDALGNPQTVTDPNNNSTIYTYDGNGRVATVKAPGDTNATQYFYVAGGCSSCGGANKIDHITLPEGNSIWYTYDTMGNLSSIQDSVNNSINYMHDSIGNKLTEQIRDSSNSLQKSLSYSYDALNRLYRITNPDSNYTQYTYDSFGNRKSVKDPNGNTTTYAYDSLNRLTSTLQPLSASTSYTYNTNNNMKTVTGANSNTTTYKYDDKGRVYQVISPDTGTTTYGYDPAGNLTSKTDAKSITIQYQYDTLNRLTKIDFPTDTDIVYTYDTCLNGKGRLCSMADASGTTTYEYTPKGQVKKRIKTMDGIQIVTQYGYDMNGNVKTITEPTGEIITNNYTNDKAVSVLKDVANLTTSINYKPFGGISSLIYGNGIADSISYDNQYRVTGITAGNMMNLSYPTYDANGNIMAINNALDPTKNKSFTYDAFDRLSTATASGIWGSLAWTYDGVGNRQTENSTSYTYQQNTNKLTGTGGTSFGYDNNGNTITQGSRVYTYNQNQRLIQVVDGAMTATYTYDGNGQRVKKVVNGVTTYFHYGERGQLIAEANGSGTITAVYVYLNGQPLAKMEGASVYYYHNDHLGTPQKMTDSSGTVVWSADYKPFGEANVTISTITNNLRFPGQYYDAETGLNYNYFRDYNPAIGRYVQADLVGLAGGINLYAYVANDPVNGIDRRGLSKEHGQWCGGDWTGGKPEQYSPHPPGYYKDAEDPLDSACKTHDICYYDCRQEFPCSMGARGKCFKDCDKTLGDKASAIGGWDGNKIAAAMRRPGARLEPNPRKKCGECGPPPIGD